MASFMADVWDKVVHHFWHWISHMLAHKLQHKSWEHAHRAARQQYVTVKRKNTRMELRAGSNMSQQHEPTGALSFV